MPEEKGEIKNTPPKSSVPRKKERPLTPVEKLEILHAPAHQQAKIEAVQKREERLSPKKTEPDKTVDQLTQLKKENNTLKIELKEYKMVVIVLIILLIPLALFSGYCFMKLYNG